MSGQIASQLRRNPYHPGVGSVSTYRYLSRNIQAGPNIYLHRHAAGCEFLSRNRISRDLLLTR